MSLLTMVTQVCRRIGIVAPNAVVSSADPQIIQLLALANEEGEELANRYPWQAMRQQATFTTVATESQGAETLGQCLGVRRFCLEGGEGPHRR